RGSIAKAGPTTVRYGGNTSCVEVRSPTGALILLDCGTGAHALGQALRSSATPVHGHILIGHTHWDHIQGIPFFAPLFTPGNEWDIYAPKGLTERLEDTLAGQMRYPYFPVSLHDLPATLRFHDLVEESFTIADVTVSTQYLNHPVLTLAYRLDCAGRSIVYATDHEPHSRRTAMQDAPALPNGALGPQDRRHCDFMAGADLVIHDAQYLASEYAAKHGLGHSTVEYAVALAANAGVRTLALFHHDPLRHDDALDGVVDRARSHARSLGSPLEVVAAAEGSVLELAAGQGLPRSRTSSRDPSGYTPGRRAVLVATANPEQTVRLQEAILADNLEVHTAVSASQALALARDQRPQLVLLGPDLPGMDTFELCRTLATSQGAAESPPAILWVADDEATTERAVAAGAADWLIWPYTQQYARTKIRTWLLRDRGPCSVDNDSVAAQTC
ncbi:MAG: response regulator, partial [Cyanobacteria bacterium REEB65]|nr:response regulator [Cyanobacteria bacterium REEB65]